MIHHLTEDQISRWFVGQATPLEHTHVEFCRVCSTELRRFRNALDSFRSSATHRADQLTRRTSPNLMQVLEGQPWVMLEQPSLLVSLKRILIDTLYPPKTETTVAPGDVKEIWSNSEFRNVRWLSIAVHAMVLGLLILPAGLVGPLPTTQTLVSLYSRSVPLTLDLPSQGPSGGGGGGGRKTLTPPSKGVPPRAADRQIVPPMVEARNIAPELVVESTVVAPQFETLQALNLPIGDPNGVVGPPSAGPGDGGGVGTGNGTGVGPGRGPGVGPGDGGGAGGGILNVGGGISTPVLRTQIPPEYSDDARKARIEGTVELLVVVREDGTVQFERVEHSLGFGLDQKAVDAVKKWTFTPARKDGRPVPVWMSIFVNFSIR
jgi:periplasmic protein TonB